MLASFRGIFQECRKEGRQAGRQETRKRIRADNKDGVNSHIGVHQRHPRFLSVFIAAKSCTGYFAAFEEEPRNRRKERKTEFDSIAAPERSDQAPIPSFAPDSS